MFIKLFFLNTETAHINCALLAILSILRPYMQYAALVLALLVYLIVIGTFLLLWMKQDHLPARTQTKEEKTLESAKNDLAVIRLLSRALMEQEHGKLNFAQIEMIHKIFAKSDHVIRQINHLRNLNGGVTAAQRKHLPARSLLAPAD